MSKRDLLHIKRDLPYVKRDLLHVKRDLPYVKRDLLYVKRHLNIAGDRHGPNALVLAR